MTRRTSAAWHHDEDVFRCVDVQIPIRIFRNLNTVPAADLLLVQGRTATTTSTSSVVRGSPPIELAIEPPTK
jgi:hypothetical protein